MEVSDRSFVGATGYRPKEVTSLELELRFEFVRGRLASWEELFAQTARGAAALRPEQLVSISHSDDDGDGIVTRWYWTARPAKAAPEPPPTG